MTKATIQNRSTKDDLVIRELPLAYADETAAVELVETQRRGGSVCSHIFRFKVLEGKMAINDGDEDLSRHYLIRAANNFSAFSEIQAIFDPLNSPSLSRLRFLWLPI